MSRALAPVLLVLLALFWAVGCPCTPFAPPPPNAPNDAGQGGTDAGR